MTISPHGVFTLIDTRELAKLLKIHPVQACRLRRRKKGPPFVRVGGAIRYLVDDVNRWLAENAENRSTVTRP
jgi:Helix-turn-helix domain